MAALEVIALDTATPQLRAPGVGDTYTFPRSIAVTGSITFDGDAILQRDAANALAQRNGTNAQSFRVYNTYTDASNYERGFMRYASNALEVGHEAAGTGATHRLINFITNNNTTVSIAGDALTVQGDLVVSSASGDSTVYLNTSNYYNFVLFRHAGTTFGSLFGYRTGTPGIGDLFHNFANHVFRSSGGVEYGRFDSSGNFLVTGDGGIGYGTGSGGAVTQATSRTTGVTLNKTNGAITLVSAAGSATWQSFTVTNSKVAAADVVQVCQSSGTDKYMAHVTAVAAGSFQITYATTGGTTTEQPVFNFAVIKAVTS
jgi:hypothetical protein